MNEVVSPSVLETVWNAGTMLVWKIFLAIIVLFIGKKLISYALHLISLGMQKKKLDDTLSGFLTSLVKAILYLLLFINVASIIGFETTSFVALLGAAGLAIGLSLQGSLSNFAGGVLILVFRPFKIGDFVEASGVAGVVKNIQILYTTINTTDNRRIVIPNGALANNPITNFSAEQTRRVDITFGISYEDNIDKAKAILQEMLNAHPSILKEPAPFLAVIRLGDSSVDIVTRSWVNAADYWPVYFNLMESVKKRFDEEGISIPYPQRTVHVVNNSTPLP